MNTIDYKDAWEDPVLFDDFSSEEIPADLLPSPFKEFAAALSKRLETPESASVLCILSVLATILQTKFKVKVDNDYSEPLNLYAMVAMPPANRKSAILKACMCPIIEYEKQEALRLEPMLKKMRSEYLSQKRLIENERKRLTVKKANEGAIEAITEKETRLIEPPALPKFYLTDATTESLAIALMEQQGKMAILSDEGGILDTFSGLYTGGTSNIDLLLKGWDGSPVCIKRREREVFLNPTLTFFMIVQPVIFENMAKNKNYIGKGFFERFLFCMPKSQIGYRTNRGEEIPTTIVKAYNLKIKELLNLPQTHQKNLTLSVSAKKAWNLFQDRVEIELRKGGQLENLQGWGGKLCGQVLRIAGLFHIARHGTDCTVINADTMNDAITLGKLLIGHACRVFENFILTADSRIKEALYVWNIIKNLKKETVTQREIVYALRHKMVAEHIKEILFILIERNLISEPILDSNKRTILYRINPKAME